MTDFAALLEQLVTANRILAREEIVDAFGHVSIRHPERPGAYLLSRSRAPELVEAADLLEFTLEGEPASPTDAPLYSERPIHGALYEARPDIGAVVHNHSPAVIPFSLTATPLRPAFHLAAIIGGDIPVWDIRDGFGDTNLLVTTMAQGRSLAAALGGNRVALMRGHGCVVAGQSLKEAVMAAVYLQFNARLLLQSLPLGEITYLSPGEIDLMARSQVGPIQLNRAWEYWAARANRPA